MRPGTTMIAIAMAAAVLAGCASHPAQRPSAAHPPITPPAAGAPVTPSVTIAPATTPAPSPTSPPANAAGSVHCASAQLRFAPARSEGAAGTPYEAIRLTNIGPVTCWTYGYAGLQILDASGRTLPTTTLPGAIALSHEPGRVTLATGRWGWFLIAYHQDTSDTCTTAPRTGARLAITAPDTTQAQVIALETHAACGQLRTSPILPASLWDAMGM